jgi:hypothetical protein
MPGKRCVRAAAPIVCLVALVGCAVSESEEAAEPSAPGDPRTRVRVVETVPMYLDKIYPSMTGPSERLLVDSTGIDWITALKTEVIDAQTDEAMGGEFICHSQFQIPSGVRILVTATGMDEIRLPPGFGIPVRQIFSAFPPEIRKMTFLGMLLNNHEPGINRFGKVRATVEYQTLEDVGDPPSLKKLYVVGAPISVEDLEAYVPPAGSEVSDDVTTHCVLVNGLTNHWMVPPGPQTTRTRLNDFIPVDSTVHYVAVHLHNYGRYMRLSNVTTGEVLWQSDVVYEKDRLQIETIPVYSSAEGFPMAAGHEYELEAFYDNTTDHDVDAMAMMYLYYHPNGDEDIVYPTELQGLPRS